MRSAPDKGRGAAAHGGALSAAPRGSLHREALRFTSCALPPFTFSLRVVSPEVAT